MAPLIRDRHGFGRSTQVGLARLAQFMRRSRVNPRSVSAPHHFASLVLRCARDTGPHLGPILHTFPGQWELDLLQDAALAGSRGRHSGRIAQLVEQLTLNQRVPGSSPGAPTKLLHILQAV